MTVKNISFEPGYIVVTTSDSATPRKYNIVDMLRAADIPIGLSQTQIAAISSLASLIAVLIRTLINRNILDESFLEDDNLDLEHIIYAIEQMGGSYSDPDIEVVNE